MVSTSTDRLFFRSRYMEDVIGDPLAVRAVPLLDQKFVGLRVSASLGDSGAFIKNGKAQIGAFGDGHNLPNLWQRTRHLYALQPGRVHWLRTPRDLWLS